MIIIKYLTLLLGIILVSSGLTFIISYLNLLTIGYNFFDYVKFIIGRLECLNFIFGIIIITFYLIKEDK